MKKQEWLISCTVVLVVALTMAAHGQEVAREPQVLVTFPEPLVELWPGDDGQILAQTTKHLYLWSEDKGIKELAVLDELHELPRSNVDWSPQRIALIGQSEKDRYQTKVSIVAPLPAHELIIPSSVRVDLISEAGVAFSRQFNQTTTTITKEGEALLAFDFDGKLVENLCKKDKGKYLVSVGSVENKPAIAVAYNDQSTLKFWLHHDKEKSDWETTLKLPNSNWELRKMQIVPQRQCIIMTIYSTGDKEFFQSQLWVISMKDGNLITRVSLPLPHDQPSGLNLRISADGRYGVFWGGSVVSVIDLTTWRVLWSTVVGAGRGMWIRSADVTSDGRVSAVFADPQTEWNMELYSFSTDGKATMVWASKETTDYVGESIGKSLFYSTDGKSVLFRYRDSILKW